MEPTYPPILADLKQIGFEAYQYLCGTTDEMVRLIRQDTLNVFLLATKGDNNYTPVGICSFLIVETARNFDPLTCFGRRFFAAGFGKPRTYQVPPRRRLRLGLCGQHVEATATST